MSEETDTIAHAAIKSGDWAFVRQVAADLDNGIISPLAASLFRELTEWAMNEVEK